MTYELILRWMHILGACTLLGTGAGIAFFMLMAHRSGKAEIIAHTAGVVVAADTIFTLSAVIIQPITGYFLAREIGWSLGEKWLVFSVILYVVTGICWLPVVWIQIKLRDLARKAIATSTDLTESYFRLFRIWFLLGIPAFFAVLTIVWLMLSRPVW